MSGLYELSVIVPTRPQRAAKLRALLASLAATHAARDRFEVLVVVDDHSPQPLELARGVLSDDIEWRGFSQAHGGPARARNLGITQARGDWLLFLDDDVVLEPDTIPRHLAQIRRAPAANVAYLGRADLPPVRLDSPWLHLLSRAPMVFFWHDLRAGLRRGFRYFWTCHLSVRTELVRAAAGFDERFPDAMHEDIELGWRLGERLGLEVEPLPDARSWHDHPLSPREYFLREYRSGRAAAMARQINPAFFDAVWGKLGDPVQTLDTLRNLFTLAGRQVLQLLTQWAVPASRCPTADELQTAYLAHLPLKRMTFCQGLVGRPFEELWETMQ